MIESATVEFKREYINDLYKEVIAFVNTSGGTIYVGVNDDGSVCGGVFRVRIFCGKYASDTACGRAALYGVCRFCRRAGARGKAQRV